jgi:hypothetical protein
MPRINAHPKVESFNFRVDPALKAAFTAATATEDKPAGQVLRDFMRAYVTHQHEAEAARQSRRAAVQPADPASEEASVMRWIEDAADTGGWTA